MVKGIIENTHIITSTITKFIWFFGYYNFFKMDMYFETERVFVFLSRVLVNISNETNWDLFCLVFIIISREL